MSIQSIPSSTYNKIDNFNRRSSVNQTSTSKSSFDQLLSDNAENRQLGTTNQQTNQGTASNSNSLPKFDSLADSLADALARSDAANYSSASSNRQLQQTVNGFENHFASAAQDPDAFNSLMQTAFGDNYDKAAAESIRQHSLAGDFSWMPDIQVVKGATLTDTSGMQRGGTGLGAYDSASDTIYLSEELVAGDSAKAVEILTEEVGHAIDTRVNTSDSAGDEGELFAKLVGGEDLSAEQIQVVRSENDHGTIVVDGKTVEVEFFSLPNPFRAVQNFVNNVVAPVVAPIVDLVVAPVVNTFVEPVINKVIRPTVNTIFSGAQAVSNNIKSIGGAISNGVSSVGNLMSDGVNWVGDKVTDGLDFVNENIVSPVLNSIPVAGPWVNDHLIQPGFGLLETGVNFATNVVDSAVDFATHGLSGAIDVTTNLLAGDLGGAWDSLVDTAQTLGQDVVGFALESLVIPFKGVATAINDMFNLTEIRGLRPEEQAYLETIYGDSIDYDEIQIQVGGGVEEKLGLDPHAVGNDIYMPENSFNPDGSLTEDGKDLLAHEVGHVWQFQNDGASYIGDAVISYGQSQIEQGNNYAAYDFATTIEEMKPWNEMTPDEQAEIAMVIGEALELGDGVLTENFLEDAIDNHNDNGSGDIDLSIDQVEYLRNIHNILLAG